MDTHEFDEEEDRLITLLESENLRGSPICCNLYCGSPWSQIPRQMAMSQPSQRQARDIGIGAGSIGSRGSNINSRSVSPQPTRVDNVYARQIPSRSPWLHAWYGEPERQSMANWFGGVFGDRQSRRPSTTVTVPVFQPCPARMPVVRLTLGFQLMASKRDACEEGYSITAKLHSFQMAYEGPEAPIMCDYRFGLENMVIIEVRNKDGGCCGCCSGWRFTFATADLAGHALDACLQMKTSGKLRHAVTFGITVHSLNGSAAAGPSSSSAPTTTASPKQPEAAEPTEFQVKFGLGFKTEWDAQVLTKFLQVVQERPKFASFFQQAYKAEDAESAVRSLEKHFVPPDNTDTLRLCVERWVFPEQFRELIGRAIAMAKSTSSNQVGGALHSHLYELGMKGSPLGCLAALSAGALAPDGDHLGAHLLLGHWIQLLRDLCSIEFGRSIAAEAMIPALVDRAVEVPDILTRLECLCVCGLAKDQLAGIEVLAVARMQESISLEELPETIGGMRVGPLAVVVSGFRESANNNRKNTPPTNSISSRVGTKSVQADDWTVALAKKVLVGCKDHVQSLETKDMSIALLWYSPVFWDTMGHILQSAHLDLTDFNLTMTAFITHAIQHFRATDLSAEGGVVQRVVRGATAMLGASKADGLDQLEWFRKVDSLLQLRSKYLPGAIEEKRRGGGTLWPTTVPSSDGPSYNADTNVKDFIELVCSWALLRNTKRALKSTLVRIVDSCTPQTTAEGDERRLECARAYAASIPKLQEVCDTYRVLTNSPVDWDIMAMAIGKITYEVADKSKAMRSEAGDEENLMVREVLSSEAEQFFQKFVDRTFKSSTRTRDRRGGMPRRLKVLGVTRVANDASWAAYVARRDVIKGRLSWLSLRSSDWPTDVTHPPITQGLPETIGSSPLPELDPAACEVWLWHGTSAAGAEGITTDDFNLDLAGSAGGMLYGRGIYLAESCTKSDEYAAPDKHGVRHLLLCRAALGRVRYLDKDRQHFSPDELVQSCSGYWAQWDSLLGDREKLRGTFREFVLYDTDSVYSNYIVKYQRVYS